MDWKIVPRPVKKNVPRFHFSQPMGSISIKTAPSVRLLPTSIELLIFSVLAGILLLSSIVSGGPIEKVRNENYSRGGRETKFQLERCGRSCYAFFNYASPPRRTLFRMGYRIPRYKSTLFRRQPWENFQTSSRPELDKFHVKCTLTIRNTRSVDVIDEHCTTIICHFPLVNWFSVITFRVMRVQERKKLNEQSFFNATKKYFLLSVLLNKEYSKEYSS